MFFFFLGLIFINLFLYYSNYLFLFFVFMCIYYCGKKCNFKLFICSVFVIILYFSFNLNYYNFSRYDNVFDQEVIVLEKYDTYSIVGDKNGKYFIYNDNYIFYENSVIYLKGEIINIKNTYNSFYNYLNKKAVNYQVDYYKLYVLENDKKCNELIMDSLLSNKSEVSKSYLKLILFNIKDDNNLEFYTTFSVYFLTYLIAVSGFHIRVLLSFFKKLFHNNSIGYFVVCFYLYLLDFSISSYRAFLCYLSKKFVKKNNFDVSNNDIISLVGSVFLIINPSIMFSNSFIFSFLTTFVLEIFMLYSKKSFVLSFYVYLINIPLILLNYHKLNVSTLFFSSVLSLPISFLYVFSFLFLFLDKFYLLYEMVINLFIRSFGFFNRFNLVLVFGKPSIVFIIVYYVFLLLFFVYKEKKSNFKFLHLFFVVLSLFYQYSIPLINGNEQVYFLNVGQGDCTVFIIPNSKKAVLLDTGGNKYSDVAVSKIIPFLESKGVNEIEKVVITHDDYDHNGALSSLKDNFVVKEVIDVSNINSVSIGNKVFKNLNISDLRDNDGSLVLYGGYAGYDLLLMGDASKKVESNIVDMIDNVDIIKIGHHGSSSSSGEKFLSEINGKIAIISVGLNNSYGHPDKVVLDNLNKHGYIIFRTDKNNNIGFGKNIFNVSFIDYFN